MITSNKRIYLREIFIGFWVLIIPFFLYFHKAFEDSKTIVIFRYTYFHGFPTSEIFMWYILIKVVAILSLLTWFFTTSYRWKYFILAPLMVYSYTLIKSFDFIPVIKDNDALYAKIITVMALVLMTLLDNYYFQTRGVIKSKVKDIGINKEFYVKVKTKKAQIEKLEKQLTFKAYFNELSKLKELMASSFFKTNSKSYAYSKWKKIFDVLICTLLALMIPIYYTFILVPPEVQTYTLFGIDICSHGFQDVNIYVWYVCLKICIIIPLCIWFITCGHWWRYAILSPIVLFTYQLWGAYQNVTKEVDNYEYLSALPTIFILVVLLIFISNRIKYQSRILDIYEGLSNEIEILLNKLNAQESKIIKEKYGFKRYDQNILSSGKATIYLQNLIRMKSELLENLDSSN